MHIDFNNQNTIPPEFASQFVNPNTIALNNIKSQKESKHNTYLLHERACKGNFYIMSLFVIRFERNIVGREDIRGDELY